MSQNDDNKVEDVKQEPEVGRRQFASRDAKTLAVDNDGNALEGDKLKAFLDNAAELRKLVRSSRVNLWRTGDLLMQMRPTIRKKEFRTLLKSLGISRSSSERYILVRRAFGKEANVPKVAGLELYAAARAKIPADPRKQRQPSTNPLETLAKTVLRKLSELVQRMTDMDSEPRQKIPHIPEILERAKRLRFLSGAPARAKQLRVGRFPISASQKFLFQGSKAIGERRPVLQSHNNAAA